MQQPSSESNYQQQLSLLQHAYQQQLPEQLSQLESAWQAFRLNNFDQQAKHVLEQTLRQLDNPNLPQALPKINDNIKELQKQFHDFLQGKQNEGNQKKIQQMLQMLRAQIEQQHPLEKTATSHTRIPHNPTTLLMALDPLTEAALWEPLQQQGYRLKRYQHDRTLLEQIEQQSIDLLLLNFDLYRKQLPAPHHLQKLLPQLPVKTLLVSADESMENRLAAVQAGGSAFFATPVEVPTLLDRIASLCGSHSTNPYRVMIIDDAIEQVQFYASLLKAHDFEVSICPDPLSIDRYLAKYDPELILMDLYMPDFNGYELAQAIRQQEALFSLPIVFLSSEHDPQLQLQALQSGGDDFLSKPVHPRRLCHTLAGHIERYRKICRHSEIDSMTGLLKRDQFQKRLESELLRAYRYQQSISLLLIDTDHFRDINQIYGFSIGDQVIKTLANLLQKRLRATDIIARYGGEKFAVILPETSKQSVEQLSNHLRDSFAATPFQGQQQSFFTSFSAGISDNRNNHSAQQLLESAEEALNEAKQNGRNCVAIQ